jgi:glycosyltransferase involved in cell wall biosynthesis
MGKLKALIYWEGFPVCGLILREVIKNHPEIEIIATRPKVPFKDLEVSLNKEINWLNDDFDSSYLIKKFNSKNLFIHTGWNNKEILKYGDYIRKNNNAKVYVSVDNDLRLSLRQVIGSIYYRLILKSKFDGALVPGIKSKKLMRFLGMNPKNIYIGLYGAYEGIFKSTKLILDRNDEFLYVGQLTKRKSIDLLVNAFEVYKANGGKWNLRIIGSGDLVISKQIGGLYIEGFLQPNEIAVRMNNSKVFVLLSKLEHWGTVVCEAAACGMQLLLTHNIGSKDDLLIDGLNGFEIFDHDIDKVVDGFEYFEKLSSANWVNGSNVSSKLSSLYNTQTYYSSFNNILIKEGLL